MLSFGDKATVCLRIICLLFWFDDQLFGDMGVGYWIVFEEIDYMLGKKFFSKM